MDGTYYSAVKRLLLIVFVLNISVALVKGAYGIFSNSLSMTADGLHSFFDSTSNIIGLVGIYLASKPPDKEHPYGHSKFETFASIGIAVLLFTSCIHVVEAAINRFVNPTTPEISVISFAIMGITMAINTGVSVYEYRIGKKLGSSILVADSMHTRSDIFASASVILGFFAIKMGYILADPIITLLITCLIVVTGLRIINESSKVLLDRALIEESIVKNLAESVQGVCDCHRVRTRGLPGEMYIDLHIGVDSALLVDQAHHVSAEVENRIKNSINGVMDVSVHVEPKDHCDIEEKKAKSSLDGAI